MSAFFQEGLETVHELRFGNGIWSAIGHARIFVQSRAKDLQKYMSNWTEEQKGMADALRPEEQSKLAYLLWQHSQNKLPEEQIPVAAATIQDPSEE